jgi:hypothetical protein
VFHRLVQGKKPTATYLWEDKGIVPFLKIDKGLQPEADGVQLMKPIPELDRTLSWCGGGGSGGGTKDPGSLKKVLDIADELGSSIYFRVWAIGLTSCFCLHRAFLAPMFPPATASSAPRLGA